MKTHRPIINKYELLSKQNSQIQLQKLSENKILNKNGQTTS